MLPRDRRLRIEDMLEAVERIRLYTAPFLTALLALLARMDPDA